jgi:hypothetical protein
VLLATPNQCLPPRANRTTAIRGRYFRPLKV